MISLFDIFKIGVGPSSSHTVGPMRAAAAFAAAIRGQENERVVSVVVALLGSLAWTGVGHATDTAVMLGLSGETPDQVDPNEAERLVEAIRATRTLRLNGRVIAFDPQHAILFDKKTTPPVHPNTMRFAAFDAAGERVLEQGWCSVGGGFIVPESTPDDAAVIPSEPAPFDFASGDALLACARRTGLSIAEIVMANERALRPAEDVVAHIDRIIDAMMACVDRGLSQEGALPGKLGVRRRASSLRERLEADRFRNVRPAHEIMDWISLFAIAVNEENAAGGRVVTAPTNGAAGVVPAVLRYYRDFCTGATREGMRDFLLTAAAIGGLFKRNASISGAEVGCQGEVGVACSMAAAGLAAALGGDPPQVENAAEIGMEHHLGMTCDPVGGLVQIPCIERNAFGAVKAVNAASLALRGDGAHHVSLDKVIVTMRETGADMNSRYKETSLGGLAVAFPEC
ncbi:L-serine deaminase [Acetobacter nitrogenifigens DSM 23921 = NBRC 105050]|uniref:L-serine dehydratase n=1 Tax=Acetobacter nitrogenifigens DSM 23921 = NBRC 105050 TaxID=1120919 RepID=A0A511XCK0_9PROT|nr:L-serine ammonia-lyase [Acetobacter nitrogenifigens]GBQ87933.1 L-serine deaminase [Acetobacter nitrogenifigens DSM 23921 = NBRC 105050]GEN60689.1 L-serine dehydratase [Acetobacter nitrogenifigens DSM 23921 = NBRC 105050]